MKQVFVMDNRCDQVEPLLNRLEKHLMEEGVDEEAVHDLRLVSEELLVNTVSYGYEEGRKDQLEVEVTRRDEKLIVQFRDRAKQFNPLDAEERDPLDDRLGGWGIPLLKELTDDVQYARKGEQNILTIEKREKCKES